MKATRYLMGALLALSMATGAGASEKANLILDWLIIGSHAGYYSALDKGFFKDQGIDMTIIPGKGSGYAVKTLGAGKVTFGYADLGAMIVGRSKGATNRMIGMLIGNAPYVLYSLEPNAVRKPKDLEGKSIASTRGNTLYILFPAFAKLAGFDANKVKWQIMTVGAMIPSLISGKVDLSAHYTGSGPIVEGTAAKNGKKAVPLYFRDYGFNIYSNGLQTQDETIAKNPKLVRAFLAAIYKGVGWAIANQKEAINILGKYNQALNPDLGLKSWQVTIKEILTDEVKKHGLGYMTAEKVKNTRKMMVDFLNVKNPPSVSESYTTEFLPGIIPPKAM
jgi:NitT/TauT family transport system substrate-binding protein